MKITFDHTKQASRKRLTQASRGTMMRFFFSTVLVLVLSFTNSSILRAQLTDIPKNDDEPKESIENPIVGAPDTKLEFSNNWSKAATSMWNGKPFASISAIKEIETNERIAIADSLLTSLALVSNENSNVDGVNPTDVERFAILIRQGKWGSARTQIGKLDETTLGFISSHLGNLPTQFMIGGINSSIDDFPWFVSLSILKGEKSFQCAGTRISKNFIITAAHCLDAGDDTVFAVPASAITVSLGSEYHMRGRILVASDRFMHPQWEKTSTKYDYDAALIKINSDHELPDSSKILLQTKNVTPAFGSFLAGGWGLLDNLQLAQTLQTGVVTMRDQLDCSSAWKDHNAIVNDQMLCAGTNAVANCRGDSGGPLLAGGKKNVQLVGIVSWGTKSCSISDSTAYLPEVYTRISAIKPWLTEFSELVEIMTDTIPESDFTKTNYVRK